MGCVCLSFSELVRAKLASYYISYTFVDVLIFCSYDFAVVNSLTLQAMCNVLACKVIQPAQ